MIFGMVNSGVNGQNITSLLENLGSQLKNLNELNTVFSIGIWSGEHSPLPLPFPPPRYEKRINVENIWEKWGFLVKMLYDFIIYILYPRNG